MTKNTLRDQSENSKDTQKHLIRRPIHKGIQHMNESQSKKFHDDLNDSPSQVKKMHKELPTEDDKDLSDAQDSEDDMNEKEYDEPKLKKHISYNVYKFLSNIIIKYFKCILLLFIISLIILVCCYLCFSDTHKISDPSLKEKLTHMKNRFQNQNILTFRILEKGLVKVVDVTNKPSAPAIFTMAVNKNAIYKSHEFSHYLANALAPQYTVLINESVSWHNNPDGIKFEIDKKIRSDTKNDSLFVVIVDNLQYIPFKSAMIFHSYCDHELAPFKQAVFLFIVPLNEILPEDASGKMIDKFAFKQIKNIWNKATSDEIDSLITRITVNVINIR